MPNKRQNPLHAISRQIRSMMRVRPFKAQQEGQQTWARVVRSRENLPEMYQNFFRSHISMGEAFPYTVLTPSYEKLGSTIAGKLICVLDGAVYVLDGNAENVIETCYPVHEIDYVEVSSKLLEFRVTVKGVTDRGIQTASLFRCSTVTDYVFAPLVERIRPRNGSPSESALPVDVETFDHWGEQNYKFMNLARHCILSGETVIAALLQPEIHSGSSSFPRRYFRRIKSPTHACILTETELIMIREDLLQSRKDKYGSTCTFIALDKILSISVISKTENLLVVSIQLIHEECFDCMFDASLEHEVEELVARTCEYLSRDHTRVPN